MPRVNKICRNRRQRTRPVPRRHHEPHVVVAFEAIIPIFTAAAEARRPRSEDRRAILFDRGDLGGAFGGFLRHQLRRCSHALWTRSVTRSKGFGICTLPSGTFSSLVLRRCVKPFLSRSRFFARQAFDKPRGDVMVGRDKPIGRNENPDAPGNLTDASRSLSSPFLRRLKTVTLLPLLERRIVKASTCPSSARAIGTSRLKAVENREFVS